ncbi:alpha-amylase family glycosyl hydrolase [Clostridium thermarum]|uniref:alpha-amylase family glycosyl hydrolase n=1 Tax=Clostridium thermarum TaxID=1716543 RepID=UPI0013D4B156|nr:alpha-amylase family glycosyl hydrolase [Clostridium thermarum]
MKKKNLLFPLIFSIAISSAGCNTTDAPAGDVAETQKQQQAVNTGSSEVISKDPEWIKNSVIYEVNWRQYTKEGTIKAFEEHLTRLKELGVDVLWFMPIYPISKEKRIDTLGSYYSVADYKAVNPELGTLDEFKAFVAKAHDIGFKIILDWVANHTGWDNEWTKNPDWYTQDSSGKIMSPAGTGWLDVADLNYDNADMRNAMIDAMKFWLKDVDIDGYRCDYAGGVPQDFWETAVAELNKIKPVYMLAEDDTNFKLLTNAFNSNYGWSLYHTLNDIVKGNGGKTALSVKSNLQSISYYPNGTYPLNFITNHDENSWNGTEFERLGDAVKTMAALTFTAPGIPLIYSGQEAGLNKRLAFFVKDEISWDDLSMQNFYKELITLKKENKALWNGTAGGNISFLKVSNTKSTLAFYREKEDSRVVVIMNLSANPVKETVIADGIEGQYKVFSSNGTINLEKNHSFELQPWEYKILVK